MPRISTPEEKKRLCERYLSFLKIIYNKKTLSKESFLYEARYIGITWTIGTVLRKLNLYTVEKKDGTTFFTYIGPEPDLDLADKIIDAIRQYQRETKINKSIKSTEKKRKYQIVDKLSNAKQFLSALAVVYKNPNNKTSIDELVDNANLKNRKKEIKEVLFNYKFLCIDGGLIKWIGGKLTGEVTKKFIGYLENQSLVVKPEENSTIESRLSRIEQQIKYIIKAINGPSMME